MSRVSRKNWPEYALATLIGVALLSFCVNQITHLGAVVGSWNPTLIETASGNVGCVKWRGEISCFEQMLNDVPEGGVDTGMSAEEFLKKLPKPEKVGKML